MKTKRHFFFCSFPLRSYVARATLSGALLLGTVRCASDEVIVTGPPNLPPAEVPEETLTPGDLLEVIFSRTNAAQPGPYRLQVGDVVSVDVADRPELSSRDLRVLPDGRISMRTVGVVKVAGRSVEQAASAIVAVLERKGFNAPDVVVAVDGPNQRLEQFLRTVAPEQQGARIQVRVMANETLSLPLLPGIHAAGRPLGAVRSDIKADYEQEFGNQVDVAVNVRERADRVVFASGEVAKPGIVPLTSDANPAMVIGAAGGFSLTADRSQILVVRFRSDGSFWHWIVDLSSLNAAEPPAGLAIPLRNRDVIYVARSTIGDVNRFVDLYIRRNIPINTGIGYTP